jgi:hypothetical protein
MSGDDGENDSRPTGMRVLDGVMMLIAVVKVVGDKCDSCGDGS